MRRLACRGACAPGGSGLRARRDARAEMRSASRVDHVRLRGGTVARRGHRVPVRDRRAIGSAQWPVRGPAFYRPVHVVAVPPPPPVVVAAAVAIVVVVVAVPVVMVVPVVTAAVVSAMAVVAAVIPVAIGVSAPAVGPGISITVSVAVAVTWISV